MSRQTFLKVDKIMSTVRKLKEVGLQIISHIIYIWNCNHSFCFCLISWKLHLITLSQVEDLTPNIGRATTPCRGTRGWGPGLGYMDMERGVIWKWKHCWKLTWGRLASTEREGFFKAQLSPKPQQGEVMPAFNRNLAELGSRPLVWAHPSPMWMSLSCEGAFHLWIAMEFGWWYLGQEMAWKTETRVTQNAWRST